MFGSMVMGQELSWRPSGGAPTRWALSLRNEPLLEFWWAPEEREVRAEAGTRVWRVPFQGTFLLRAAVLPASSATPVLFFAGSMRSGFARCASGPGFILFTGFDRHHGPWIGIDDDRGTGVIRARGRVGEGRIWTSVRVTPDPGYSPVVEPLLLLWGALQILRRKNPWLTLTTVLVSEGAVQGEIESLLRSQGG